MADLEAEEVEALEPISASKDVAILEATPDVNKPKYFRFGNLTEAEVEEQKQLLLDLEEQVPPEILQRVDALERLVCLVCNLTTLYDLQLEDWTDDLYFKIACFFQSTEEEVLTIFFDVEGVKHGGVPQLMVEFGVPDIQIQDLTYFIKEPDILVTPDNFGETVMWGTVSGDSIQGSLLNVLQNVYAPFICNIKSWPDTVKSDFCVNMHKFLARITDLHYKMQGLTIMYVPNEGFNIPVEEACKDRELIRRLESVLVHWVKQMKIAVNDQQISNTQEVGTPLDEFEFWRYRVENLAGLIFQLENPVLQHITKILEVTQSTYIKQFMSLAAQIMYSYEEAVDNVNFLQILRQPCDELAKSEPKDIAAQLQHLVQLARVIWVHSKYYNTNERLTTLFKSMSNLIIQQCIRSVNLDEIFAGKTRYGLKILNECADCCSQWQLTYHMVSQAHIRKGRSKIPWNLDKPSIFNNVDIYIQRCKDMIEVCRAMIELSRIDESLDIPAPVFPGMTGMKFEKICMKVEDKFQNYLTPVAEKKDIILDVNNKEWNDEMEKFRDHMRNLDIMVEHLVETAFYPIKNVKTGVDTMLGFYTYLRRTSLKSVFDKQFVKLYKIFGNLVQYVKEDVTSLCPLMPKDFPRYAGHSYWCKAKKDKLLQQRQLMIDAVWLPETPLMKEVFQQCDEICALIEEITDKNHESWLQKLDLNLAARLDRPILRRSPNRPGLIEANHDNLIFETFVEVEYWLMVGREVPVPIELMYQRYENLRLLMEHVREVATYHNLIIRAVSCPERALFKERIKRLDKLIAPGFKAYTFSMDMSIAFVTDILEEIKDLHEFVSDYKLAKDKILKMGVEVSHYLLIAIRKEYTFQHDELERYLAQKREKCVAKIKQKYVEIAHGIGVMYEGFLPEIHEVIEDWKKLMVKVDGLLQESLRLSVKQSLEYFHRVLQSDGKLDPFPLLEVKASLKGTKIEFTPSLQTIANILGSMLDKFCDSLNGFARLPEKIFQFGFGGPSYAEAILEDRLCRKVQATINEEMQYNVRLIQEEFINVWLQFKYIWDVNKDAFIKRYERQKPSVAQFDADISRYSEVANNVQMVETVKSIYFIIIDGYDLKMAIIEHCTLWQNKLTTLLTKVARENLETIYDYITTNTDQITKSPRNLDELQAKVLLHEKLIEEIPLKEKQFPVIKDQFLVLDKYGIVLTDDDYDNLNNLQPEWDEFLRTLAIEEDILELDKDRFRHELLDNADSLKRQAEKLYSKFLLKGPFTSEWKAPAALKELKKTRAAIADLRSREAEVRAGLLVFGIAHKESPDLEKLEKDIDSLEVVWLLTDEWDKSWAKYKTCPFRILQTEEMEEQANFLFKKLVKLSKELRSRNWEIVDHTKNRIDVFKRTMPLITNLKNPAMRVRHWKQVQEATEREFDPQSNNFTLEKVIEYGFAMYAETIMEISNAATMELAIERGLDTIRVFWEALQFDVEPYKDRGIYRLKTVDDIMQALEDNQVSLSGMKSTKYVEPFIQEVDQWERTLSLVLEIVEAFLTVQRQWLYLENIFLGEDIRKQLPKETADFDSVTSEWKSITSRMHSDKSVLVFTHYPGLLRKLNLMNERLENIQRSLEMYLETKRHVFPRFYFISNDDLLAILGQSKRPETIQPHLKKLFDSVHKIKIMKAIGNRNAAEGMYSGDGEYIDFTRTVLLEGPVEWWLCDIEAAMRETLKELLKQCIAALKKMLTKRDKWIKEWPGQLCITSSQVRWTTDCTRTLIKCRALEARKPLKKLRRKCNMVLGKFSDAVRGELTKLQRLKVVGIVTIEIHARDVVDKMYKGGCKDVTAFEWLSQLRFYWDREIDNCVVRQTNTSFLYGYEYLGNTPRLAITPLTDRCYITLTTALHMHRGGSPKGPAGTGKTETVKDLGKALGMYVIVINCSEGLDYKSMGRMFSGLSQSGAWGCFDEFNRINIEVLSVVAQQILSILQALTLGLKKFVFEGATINLIPTCGIFITMNPGYAGRTELPDNLKSMFRPISMVTPDSALIAEITLFGEGFRDTRALAKKVYTLYSLAMQQLSKQDHYDFGLRGMVALLRYAGKKRRQCPDISDEEVLLLAMKDMNVAKLTSDDLPLFNGICSDLFPGVDAPVIEYEDLAGAATKELTESGLQATPNAVLKIIQLYETKNSRHSVMIVGATGSGKSVTWKGLQGSLTRLKQSGCPGYNAVKDYPINPKALSLGELYGEFDLSTNEWLDGVLSSVMRQTCADEKPDEKWIVFDGPVDAVWIENMNSVMDDNKVLTLINSERITMPEQVSLLFEVGDLAVASPATVSRCGMVYSDYKDLGWKPYVQSWLQRQPNKLIVEKLKEHFQKYISDILEFKRRNCKDLVPVPELASIISLCRLLECFMTKAHGVDPNEEDLFETAVKQWFVFCLIWSVCCTVDEDGRYKLDPYLRELEGIFPSVDTVYEYFVDPRSKGWVHWEERLPANWKYDPELPFYKIIVPAIDIVRYTFLVANLLKKAYPILLVGAVGVGKTSIAQSVLQDLDPMKFLILSINMSAQTTSNNVQSIIEGRVEKRTKGVFVPVGGKTMITFLDDLNMPAKETYGSQPPLELIRMWIDYGFWYDRQKQVTVSVKDMLLMSAMGPPGGGRSYISSRLQSRFNVVNMTFPTDAQVESIFGPMLQQKLGDFDEDMKPIGKNITDATINMYKNVVSKMLPTPTKIHYLFNLRDISKIFQGLLRSQPQSQSNRNAFCKLWVHECFRVFCDRMVDERDREWFLNTLNECLGQHFDLTFNALCPSKRPPMFGDFMNQQGLYQDLDDTVVLKQHLENQLLEYNNSIGVIPMDLVLFRDAMDHITRIVRVISQPRGNMLVIGIGGSGRMSLVRLSTFICLYETFTVEVTKLYRKIEFREDLKKLYAMTGVQDKLTSFLFNDTQVTEECFMEDINNILSSGEVPNLYKPDEFEEMKGRLSSIAQKEGLNLITTEQLFGFLIERVRANLHVCLCLSPIGEPFRNRIRQYPAFVNCATIDWFTEWPQEALLEVAQKYLMDVTLLEIPDTTKEQRDMKVRIRNSIALIFANIHRSVCENSAKMLLEMKRHNYVTPVNYFELVSGYKGLLYDKRRIIGQAASKLRNGLWKLDDTRQKVEVMSLELAEAQVKVAEFTQQCEDYIVVIQQQTKEADEQQQEVALKSIKIREEEVACKKLADIAMADLQEAMPALEEAVRALDALNKKDLSEVRSYGRPPERVELVMSAVMVLLKREPTWQEAKKELADPNFLNRLKEFDKDNIPDKVLKKIGTFTENEEFQPDKVGIVSQAAKSLCMWVRAIEKYGKIYKIVAPKKERLRNAEMVLAEKQRILAEAQAKLDELSQMLEKLKKEFEEKLAQKEELRLKAEMLQMKLERAFLLVSGLAGEKDRWEETLTILDQNYTYLPGDCLLSTAFVSYMGPFVSKYRDEMEKLWVNNIHEEEVPCSPAFAIENFLSDPATIREWNIQGLPADKFSTENGIIATRGSRWPLLIDPQTQGMKWIKNMEKEKLKIIDLQQSNYMAILERAIQFGEVILLKNVLETLDAPLAPILNKAFVKQGGDLMIRLIDKTISYNTNFRFYITTKLSNPHYAPEISTKTTLVNFAVKEQGLELQLLGIVVRKERPDLEEQKDKLVLTIANGKKKLIELEDELLRLLNESKGSLLDDIELIDTLQVSKNTSKEVKESLETSVVTEAQIDKFRMGYRPCAQRAAILFFVLNDMCQIDPMYQFSLDAYINLFVNSIEKSEKSNKLEQRIENLNDFHTFAVYRNTCRGLFENHKLLFSFHMCVKILQATGKVNRIEYNFLLKGGVVLDREGQMENPCPGWLSDTAWDNVTELDKLPGFHGVVNTFEQFPRDWYIWYTHTEPETQPLIGEWESICNELQRMLFVRSLRSDRMSFCVSTFVVNNLGPRFVEPPVLNMLTVLDDSSRYMPLIFVLSPGVDPTGSLITLSDSMGMRERFSSLSLGQGQAPLAERMMNKGIQVGHWVFLANCHLSLSWMPQLDQFVDNLQDVFVHPDFRLWLSSSPHPDFPISVLQAGIKMTTEPPKGIKANMKRLYQTISDAQFQSTTRPEKFKKLLFSLCFFHSVLLERRKFQQLGWNVVYSFNDSDFEVSSILLNTYLNEYEDTPWDALKYLIARVNYGGHVTDDYDGRLLQTYINQYFCEDALTTPYFRLSSLTTYYIPRDGSLESYHDHISMMPTIDRPEAFGQHPNADITSQIIETINLFKTLLSLQFQAATGEGESREEKVLQLAADVLSRIPDPIDYENAEKLIGKNKKPLDVVLLQEITRYNVLLKTIRASVEELQKGIKGLVVMSTDLENIFTCIYDGRVPDSWLKAYPSLKPLGSWTRDLISRVEQFSSWAQTTHPPVQFWLSAFTFPTGFLTAVLQTAARQAGISVDLLSWEFTVFVADDSQITQRPLEGVYVRGLYLEGAGWDRKYSCLVEPLPMQLVCPMPVIHFKPVEQLKKKSRGLYNCPCYSFPIRAGGSGRPSFVVAVDLKSGKENADHWIKRGTALILSLQT